MALTDNQLHVWHFNESSGNAADSVGSMTLTNNGTITYGAGLLANCALGTGVNQYFDNTAASFWASTPTSFTVNVWIQASSTPGTDVDYMLINTDGTTNPGSLRLHYRNASSVVATVFQAFDNTGSGAAYTIANVQTLTTNTWYMWTATWSGTAMELFINASSVGTLPLLSFGRNDPVSSFTRIMGQGGGDALQGKMDEFGVWTRQLSGSEITQLYNGGAGLAYPYTNPGPTNVKTWDGVTQSSGVKTYEGVAIASVKSVIGVT